MTISQRTASANRLVYLDDSGIPHEILLALLGGRTVWDGRISQSVPASTGSMSISGFVAEVSSGSAVTATDVGYATLLGLAAHTSAGSTVSAAHGELDSEGLSADIRAGSTLDVDPGSLIGAGLDADVTVTIGPVLDPGHVMMDGLAADVVVAADISATVGGLTFAGLPADVLGGSTVDTAGGSGTLAGMVAEVSSSSTVASTDVGYATLAGLAAGISTGSTVGVSVTPDLAAVGLVADAVAIHFTPSGMTKNGSTQGFSGLTPVQIVGMAPESGSTLSGSALLPNGGKIGASVACQVYCTGIGYGNTLTVQVRKNGVLIPGASITTSNIYVSTYTVVVPTATVDVAATDQITVWINASSSGSATIAAGTGTFVRIA